MDKNSQIVYREGLNFHRLMAREADALRRIDRLIGRGHFWLKRYGNLLADKREFYGSENDKSPDLIKLLRSGIFSVAIFIHPEAKLALGGPDQESWKDWQKGNHPTDQLRQARIIPALRNAAVTIAELQLKKIDESSRLPFLPRMPKLAVYGPRATDRGS